MGINVGWFVLAFGVGGFCAFVIVAWALRSDLREWAETCRDLRSQNHKMLDKRDSLESKIGGLESENRGLKKKLESLSENWQALTGYADELRGIERDST